MIPRGPGSRLPVSSCSRTAGVMAVPCAEEAWRCKQQLGFICVKVTLVGKKTQSGLGTEYEFYLILVDLHSFLLFA